MVKTLEKKQVVLDREYVEELEKKASIFEEILSFLEDKYIGYLMNKTEREKNISLNYIIKNRRGWAEKENIVNTQSAEKLLKSFKH